MTAQFGIFLLVLGSSAYAVLTYRRTTRRLMTLYGDEFRAYNAAAFKEIIEESPNENLNYVTRLATEVESKKGQQVNFVHSSDGAAIHHINQNGTFSAKGPYFVSVRSNNWRRTGRLHLVKVMRGRGGRIITIRAAFQREGGSGHRIWNRQVFPRGYPRLRPPTAQVSAH
jgi:hypothetical protein